ncbi:MAG: hypothetical protein G01um101418_306 [Parcubacteria group bacterium Gr01-1014_18]|nr:MAG: hypothetical protein Greene041636_318 [Parcubacteria group bacterium Greene0416_36]TSC81166.1 MAG: hypothetical protein G01um101418_306 [Parcubacteria group bacterium Gr01-1014_18]TSC99163.1 MAG: hypothetical protein Greene101420_308 [Parcubacteria group bacterium Greene1014_20]TSD07479.1 MAG: hypothetical protein Greene07142_178 [Parcubacteria group bacterium Greene0714_2]
MFTDSLLKVKPYLFYLCVLYSAFFLIGLLNFTSGGTTPPSSGLAYWLLLFWMILAGISFIFFAKSLLGNAHPNLNQAPAFLKIIWAGFFLFSFILILIPPVLSQDLYNYIFSARIGNGYELNPYLYHFNFFRSDPFLETTIANWRDQVTPYGPVWTSFSMMITRLAGTDLPLNLFLFRLANIFFIAGSGLILFRILEKKAGLASRSLVLFLWNPLILLEGISSGHNEAALLFFLLASFYFLSRKNSKGVSQYALTVFSFVFLAIAFWIKYWAVFFIPAWFFLWWREGQKCRGTARCAPTLLALVAGIIVTLVAWAPFWDWDHWPALLSSVLIQAGRMDYPFYFGSGSLIGFWLVPETFNLWRVLCLGLWIVVSIVIFVRMIRGKIDPYLFGSAFFFFFLFLVATWVQPWYALIILPFLLLEEKYLGAYLIMSALFLLTYFVPAGVVLFGVGWVWRINPSPTLPLTREGVATSPLSKGD